MYFYYQLFKHYQGPNVVQSNPPIPPILGLAKKQRYSENGGIGTYNIQNPHLRLGRYLEGTAVFRIGRGGIEGGDCTF